MTREGCLTIPSRAVDEEDCDCQDDEDKYRSAYNASCYLTFGNA
jgi:hypothetical protein